MENAGLTLTEVIERAWAHPFTTRCNFARNNAELVGIAASEGLITLRHPLGTYFRRWRVTPKGLTYLAQNN